ncbi:glycoside hydrolase family 16 protein [Puniceicoccales bacterium CK1056]|uniref:Glycoside hydrolase family 16 protein n=1 Tax=Oceanipulchritudo coccoides TaxID=2706888 RepID=A0A6B2LYI3_9BACT|nr:glycoside hydrolase family 16 protein [Oceanipulchritudo coccoides]NDV61212.1 glycoside hydrolase family 16 protein [Oceanipulchritudo coccoides]
MKQIPSALLSVKKLPALLSLLTLIPLSAFAQYSLVWSDEFDQPDGSAPDPANWGYDIGGGGWGNSELQWYTDRRDNSRIENGELVIEAKEEAFEWRDYTSARLLTKGKQEFLYGRIEARIKVPAGPAGFWPAFWTLGADIDTVGWPQCGEIDIMEYVSREPNEIFGTIHGPLYNAGASIGDIYTFDELVSDNYHTFTVDWQPNLIRWYVDGILYHTATPDTIGSTRGGPKEWVFDKPHFLILNVAIGGTFGGELDPTLEFPLEMQVDYVRVYEFDYGIFNGYPQDGDWINTGAFMGLVNIAAYPWVYVDSLGDYIYAAPSDSNSGWAYLPK